jgi:hypothetical protein
MIASKTCGRESYSSSNSHIYSNNTAPATATASSAATTVTTATTSTTTATTLVSPQQYEQRAVSRSHPFKICGRVSSSSSSHYNNNSKISNPHSVYISSRTSSATRLSLAPLESLQDSEQQQHQQKQQWHHNSVCSLTVSHPPLHQHIMNTLLVAAHAPTWVSNGWHQCPGKSDQIRRRSCS